MMKVSYSGVSFLVTDELSDALLDYARELAERSGSDTVYVPVLAMDGTEQTAEVLLGPASQLAAIHVDEEHPMDVTEALADLRSRTLRISSPVARADEPWEYDPDLL